MRTGAERPGLSSMAFATQLPVGSTEKRRMTTAVWQMTGRALTFRNRLVLDPAIFQRMARGAALCLGQCFGVLTMELAMAFAALTGQNRLMRTGCRLRQHRVVTLGTGQEHLFATGFGFVRRMAGRARR